jgi:hypothetical protein
MSGVTIVRIYFKAEQILKAGPWWRRLLTRSLGPYLLEQSKQHNIKQAILYCSRGGYLPNERLVFDNSDIAPPQLPQCLELIATESELREFLNRNAPCLSDLDVILIRADQIEIVAQSGNSS